MASLLRVVYMGTPEFAVLPLQTLYQHNYNIVGVVTAPDKPAGRGHQIQMSAVKQYALQNDLNILQPTNLKSEDFISQLQDLKPDVIIVIAFRMLPKLVWEIPKYGTINLHASLLPQYRGAAPINWAIVNGERTTGVTSFYINETIDTGNILLHKTVTIDEKETAGELHDKLMICASKLVIETITSIENNNNKGVAQDSISLNEELHHAPKLSKEICRINWSNSCENIYNHIRGFSPYPGAWTELHKESNKFLFKIFFAEYKIETHSFESGTLFIKPTHIEIATNDGFIIPTDIQIEGKKRMKTEECLRGFSFVNTKID